MRTNFIWLAVRSWLLSHQPTAQQATFCSNTGSHRNARIVIRFRIVKKTRLSTARGHHKSMTSPAHRALGYHVPQGPCGQHDKKQSLSPPASEWCAPAATPGPQTIELVHDHIRAQEGLFPDTEPPRWHVDQCDPRWRPHLNAGRPWPPLWTARHTQLASYWVDDRLSQIQVAKTYSVALPQDGDSHDAFRSPKPSPRASDRHH